MGSFSFFILCSTICCSCISLASSNEIDDYLYSLDYNRDQVLASAGQRIDSFLKKEGKLNDQKKFVVITREKKTLGSENFDIGVVTSNEHITYPGSLLLANKRLLDNMPDQLVISRAPIKYTINLPGMIDGDENFSIKPTFSDYEGNLNKALKTWFEKYTKDHTVVALFQSDSSFAYSKEQLRVKFDLNFKGSSVESNIDFSAINKQEKTVMVHKFKQIFYTVSVQAPKTPSELFGGDVTKQIMERKFNSSSPPVLVDSVSYGRVIYVVMETSSTDTEAKAYMQTKLSKIDIKNTNEMDYSKNLKNFNMKVYVMGGSTDHIKLISATTLKEVVDVIIQHGKFDRDNLGYPVSYSTIFVKDNNRAVVRLATEYTETTRNEYSSGTIKLSHYGGYVAQFEVYWDEVNFDTQGNEMTIRKYWNKNWKGFTAPFNEDIELPGNARNIRVFARECTGLVWEWWRTVVDRTSIPLINWREFKISGTTLQPTLSISPPL